MNDKHIALYGTVSLRRGICKVCDSTSLIKDGKFLCCETLEQDNNNPKKYVRMISGTEIRRYPSKKTKEAILTDQNNQCLICEYPFGKLRQVGRKIKTCSPCWDHYIPFAYLGGNPNDNWIALCYLCNGIKSSRMFDSLSELKRYVVEKLLSKYNSTILCNYKNNKVLLIRSEYKLNTTSRLVNTTNSLVNKLIVAEKLLRVIYYRKKNLELTKNKLLLLESRLIDAFMWEIKTVHRHRSHAVKLLMQSGRR